MKKKKAKKKAGKKLSRRVGKKVRGGTTWDHGAGLPVDV